MIYMLDKFLYHISNKTLTNAILRKKIKFFFDFKTQTSNYTSSLNPIIIGGCPRSGTTLGRALIGAHPKIASPQRECHILLGIKKRASLQEAFELTDSEISELFKQSSDVVRFCESVFKLYMRKCHKKLICVKAPAHIYFIEKMFRYFPGMKFIHIIRDGRDTACSLRTHPKRKLVAGKFVATNVKKPFAYCIRRWVSAINQGVKGRNYNNYIEIKYEDMVKDTVRTMETLYGFLSLEMISEEELLGFYKKEIPEKHPSNIEIGRPLYEGSVGKWKQQIKLREKLLFKKMAGDLLIQLGYEKNLNW